jgi:deoxyribodipyrimidine photo-lyase
MANKIDFSALRDPAQLAAYAEPWLSPSRHEPFSSAPNPSKIDAIDPVAYGKERNMTAGCVTHLSPQIERGIIDPLDLIRSVVEKWGWHKALPLTRQCSWRLFFEAYYEANREAIWSDIEPYKTGWDGDSYGRELPGDIRQGDTGLPLIDCIVDRLKESGYLHNRLRLYFAAYVVHFRRIAWQAGASFFLEYLRDGNLASNNLSWQWVASTFGAKPYIFNWDNVEMHCPELGLERSDHPIFDHSYEELSQCLFQ